MRLDPLYFGCHKESGHYFFRQGMQPLGEHRRFWVNEFSWIDGRLCPPGPQYEGVANLTRLSHEHAPVTVLSVWDRSVDSRPGSNSNFLLPGVLSFDDAMRTARALFPEVFQRFTFAVVEWDPLTAPASGREEK